MVRSLAALLPLVGSIVSLSQTAWAAPSPLLVLPPLMALLPGTIVTYPLPSIYKNSTHFQVRANKIDIPVVAYEQYDYAHFSMDDKPAMIWIKLPKGKEVKDVRISPRKLGIVPMKKGDTLHFRLPKNNYLIVKIEGHKELVIAADPLEQNKPSDKGDSIYNIKDDKYKADSEGKNLTTEAFQKAIDDASKAWDEAKAKDPKKDPKQGTVYVPKGVYTVGNLVLKSNTALYLEGGAVLRFSGKPENYTKHWFKKSQNRDVTWWIRTEFNSTNIKVHGRGTLDGNGHYSSTVGKINMNILVPIATKNFEAEGIIIRESASWSVLPMRSSDLKFHHLKLLNRLDMSENDGIDPMESQRVTISNTIGISLDDPFSTKTYTKIFPKFNDKLPSPMPLENVTFDNVLSWTRCFGLKVGQGVFTNQSNVTFKNSVVYDAAIGIGINHKVSNSIIHVARPSILTDIVGNFNCVQRDIRKYRNREAQSLVGEEKHLDCLLHRGP